MARAYRTNVVIAALETTSQFTATWDILIGGLEIVSVTVISLVFFAPAFYQRWINGVAPAAKAEEG